MNLSCRICSDLFSQNSEIYVTACGHLFHYHCIVQWIEISQTCPQCRSKSTEEMIRRVYLSVEENPETTDASLLQQKLDNMHLQLDSKDRVIKSYKEKCETARTEKLDLCDKLEGQENENRVLKSEVDALKEQTSFFKEQAQKKEKAKLVKLNGQVINSLIRRKQIPPTFKFVQSDALNSKKEVTLLTKASKFPRLQFNIELMDDNNSEYFSISTSSMTTKFSIFKQQSVKGTLIRPGPQNSCNGLGGHSEDDEYPSPLEQL